MAVTPEKILRAGNPVWHGAAGTSVRRRPLRQSIRCDVVIVGAGISGAFMAHALAPRYERVVVVDRRRPMQGATSASTAMLQFEIDEPLTALADKIGPAKAARAWRRSYRATQDIVRLVKEEGIRCGLERRASLYLAGNDMGARGLAQESRARGRAGLPGEFLDKGTLAARFGIDRTGAIHSPDSATANPVQLAAGLLRRAVEQGAEIHAPVNVEDVLATRHGVVLDTGGHFIEAKHAVFCTGYEVLKGVPSRGAKITSSWAIATRPGATYPAWLDETLVWEAATPYLYLRTTPDGRVVAGGEDEEIDLPSYRARSIERKSARLAAKVAKLIPGLDLRPVHKWTGAFGESTDGLPMIDAVPDMPGCFAVMGFGGNGAIYSMIASQIVPSLMRGRPDKDATLFGFDRR
jgi:glycine/D-amino acid oxidase-like deaminating enzyme